MRDKGIRIQSPSGKYKLERDFIAAIGEIGNCRLQRDALILRVTESAGRARVLNIISVWERACGGPTQCMQARRAFFRNWKVIAHEHTVYFI